MRKPEDSPIYWINLCISAAEEAESAVTEKPPRSSIAKTEIAKPGAAKPDQLPTSGTMSMKDFRSWADALREEKGEPPEPVPPASPVEPADDSGWQAASFAFLCTMPALVTRNRTRCFIACVAAGVQRQYIDGTTARALLYTAQLALAAFGKPGSRKPGRINLKGASDESLNHADVQ